MIELTDWLRLELWRRRDLEAPEEACGLISRGGHGLSLWGATNVASEPERAFEIAPGNLLAIVDEIEKQGQQLVGVYHSHSGTPAPSPADVETATRWPGLTWVIVGAAACPNCDEGTVTGIEAECCGNLVAGDCCGCPVPVHIPEPCPTCGTSGAVPDYWVGVLA